LHGFLRLELAVRVCQYLEQVSLESLIQPGEIFVKIVAVDNYYKISRQALGQSPDDVACQHHSSLGQLWGYLQGETPCRIRENQWTWLRGIDFQATVSSSSIIGPSIVGAEAGFPRGLI
jgi:hypothetical protein